MCRKYSPLLRADYDNEFVLIAESGGPADEPAVVTALLRVSALLEICPEIQELDISPEGARKRRSRRRSPRPGQSPPRDRTDAHDCVLTVVVRPSLPVEAGRTP
jgi:hypothetical protein